MKKYSKWLWIQIIAGLAIFVMVILIIFPMMSFSYIGPEIIILIVLLGLVGLGLSIGVLVAQIRYIMALNKLKEITQDDSIEKLFFFQLGALLAPYVGLGIATYVFNILTYIEMKSWFHELCEINNQQPLSELEENLDTIKLGQILSILVVGVFIIPVGFSKAGENLIYEHRRTQFKWVQRVPHGKTINPPKSSYDSQTHTQAPPQHQPYHATPLSKNSTSTSDDPGFCPSCGSQIRSPTAKYCEVCGKPLQE